MKMIDPIVKKRTVFVRNAKKRMKVLNPVTDPF